MMATTKPSAPLALVLAAGPAATGRDLLLKRLGEATVIDHVLATVAAAVPAANITVVVPRDDVAVAQHLGPAFRYAAQGEPLGPAAAVRAGLDATSQLESGGGLPRPSAPAAATAPAPATASAPAAAPAPAAASA
ncbi:MAG: NTP transferase domain-containing protein, partial [Bifidobacteriaceae bacterium]|nr:NTP transferase domain-containing protein [Bifidobacteriaceae bacterium]